MSSISWSKSECLAKGELGVLKLSGVIMGEVGVKLVVVVVLVWEAQLERVGVMGVLGFDGGMAGYVLIVAFLCLLVYF